MSINKEINYRICSKCVMDTTDPDIQFDEEGICNHCQRYVEMKSLRMANKSDQALKDIVARIKSSSKGEYDCIIGVSGGVDSSYVAYLVKQLGLNPLAVHFDNGWNSELAVKNIEELITKLDIDLYTYVIDWNEFRSLQLSFLKASTPDGEIPTDHAINALLFREAAKRNIKYIINGMNFATEAAAVTKWAYGHSDWKYIRSVHRIFNGKKLRHYPYYSLFNLFNWTFIKGVRVLSILNYIQYNKQEAIELLKTEVGWKPYANKHYESVYTRFYQGYILPNKFKIDKRKIHLSDMINSGQITRNLALEELKKTAYDEQLLRTDFDFVIKKFGMKDTDFERIMKAPLRTYEDYPNNFKLISNLKKFYNSLRRRKILYK